MPIPSPAAFSPGSVTCFFVPSVGTGVEDTSSPGCGINLSHGVTSAVRPATRSMVRLNGVELEFAPVRSVLAELAPESQEVFLESPLPLGCGFGVSAAAALTTALAVARRYDLGKSRQELAQVALRAEIEQRTGIGDVPTQVTGGVVCRRWRTGPFDAERLPVPSVPLYYCVFAPLATRDVLTNAGLVRMLASEGREALAWLERHLKADVAQILARSLAFARGVGLVTDPRVVQAIGEVEAKGGRATMVMLGHSVLASVPGKDESSWLRCDIDLSGTRYLP
jgi:pantoate kinase